MPKTGRELAEDELFDTVQQLRRAEALTITLKKELVGQLAAARDDRLLSRRDMVRLTGYSHAWIDTLLRQGARVPVQEAPADEETQEVSA